MSKALRRHSKTPQKKRQGSLLGFGVTGALAVALVSLASCQRNDQSGSGPVMIVPPGDFSPNQASYYSDTNQPPVSPYVYSGSGTSSYLGSQGYYRIYGYPDYFYRPAPGTAVELLGNASTSYRAYSTEDARESVARGGFGRGESGAGHGFGE